MLSDASTTENGTQDEEPDELRRDEEELAALITTESAFGSDSNMCDTNHHLNALNVNGCFCRDEGLKAAVSTEE